MDPVIIVSGEWVYKKRYTFNADKRGCRVLLVTEGTTFIELVQMIMEDYGLDKRSCKIQLSYMFSTKTLKKMSHDTPPVFICNSRQLQSFLSLRKSEQLRLCVEVTEKEDSEVTEKDKAKEKLKRPLSYVSEEEIIEESKDKVIDSLYKRAKSEEIFEYADMKSNDPIYEVKDEVEDVEDDEFDSRFDILDDPDGASSDDDNFSLFGKHVQEDEDSPTLPPKKRPQNTVMNESKANEFLKLEMSSLDIAVGQRYESKKELERRLKVLTVRDRFDFDVPTSRADTLIVKCWVKGCSWRVRASTQGESPEFYIRIYDSEHTCSVTERSTRSRQATPDILGAIYREFLGDTDPSVLPRHVGVAITKQFGIKVYLVSSTMRLIYLNYMYDAADLFKLYVRCG